MSKLLSKQVYLTADEEYNAGDRIAREIDGLLEELSIDVYNKQYLVVVEVHEL